MKNTNAYELAAQDIRNRSEKAYSWYLGCTDYKVYRTEDPDVYRVEEPNGVFFDSFETIIRDLEMIADTKVTYQNPQAEDEWYQREKALYGSNGPVIAHDSMYGEYEKTFDSYDALRKEWPGAEIVGYEMQEAGKGCIVYC